jgi:hypothetical protein
MLQHDSIEAEIAAEGWQLLRVGRQTFWVPEGWQPVTGTDGVDARFIAPPGAMGAGYEWRWNVTVGRYEAVRPMDAGTIAGSD